MGTGVFDLSASQGVPVNSLSQSGLHGTPFGGPQPTSNSQNFLGSSTVLTFSYGGINNANLRRGDSLLEGLGGAVPPVATPSEAMDSDATGQYSDEMDADEEAPEEIHQEIEQLSPQEREQVDKAKHGMNQLADMLEKLKIQIEEYKVIQSKMLQSHDLNVIKTLVEQQQKLMTTIQIALQHLFAIVMNIVLDAESLHKLRMLVSNYQLQMQRLDLFRQECKHYAENQQTTGVCALRIMEQPLPQILFKGKQIEEQYTLCLLTGTTQNFDGFSEVRAVLVGPEQKEGKESKKKKEVATLENASAAFDSYEHQALFASIKVNISTRMTPVHFKFGLQVRNGDFSMQVESGPSYPFIVITNESQWCEAAGKLLHADAFADNAHEITWAQYANTLQSHFLRSTWQNSAAPVRPIQFYEFRYFHQKFFNGQARVTQTQANKFWEWFGQILQTIRFKRHIAQLWENGIIYGFMTKEECNKALATQSLGTFLIRFSESNPGMFAIAYVYEKQTDGVEKIKHFLVKSEDIGSNKSLPDFLREKELFQYLLKIEPETGKLTRMSKETGFKEFYSKRKMTQPPKGYYIL
jgi:hypothetical protein